MYTDCPGCQRQFHVYAAQLSAARGMVKCGFCGQTFNALDRLRDSPLGRPKNEPPVMVETEPQAEPEFVIPDQDEAPVAKDIPAGREMPAGGETASAVEKTREKITGHHGTETAPVSPAKGRPEAAPAASDKSAFIPRPADFDYTEALLEQPVRKSGWVSRLVWGIGILLLLVAASSQIIWFNRDAIMGRYPASIPWFNKFCQKFKCEIIRHRDPGAIELLNRDVRDHPRFKNALLVNATMINRSQTVQAYPVVQLNLFDVDGKLIAYRRFQPKEYLDDSINILQGMAPNVPVHFVLEVLDSAKGAVSFEFEFH